MEYEYGQRGDEMTGKRGQVHKLGGGQGCVRQLRCSRRERCSTGEGGCDRPPRGPRTQDPSGISSRVFRETRTGAGERGDNLQDEKQRNDIKMDYE